MADDSGHWRQYSYACQCRQAIKRDPASVKALLRAGRAHMGLHVPSKAAQMFQQAVQLDCTNTAAQVCSFTEEVLHLSHLADHALHDMFGPLLLSTYSFCSIWFNEHCTG